MTSNNKLVERNKDQLFNEFLTSCPYGLKAVAECPALHGDDKVSHFSPEQVHQFLTECPYAKRAVSGCPHHGNQLATDSTKLHHDFTNEFFTECPVGRKAAAKCPVGHDILEKAGVEVPELEKPSADGEHAKCPFAKHAPSDAKCPVTGNDHASTTNKCPVGGVMPHSDKCPFSPNYKQAN